MRCLEWKKGIIQLLEKYVRFNFNAEEWIYVTVQKKNNSNSAVDTTSTFHILIGAFLNKGDNRYLVIVDIKRGI